MVRKQYSSSYSSSGSSGSYTDDSNDSEETDLFREAEELIKTNLAKLFSVSSTCSGVKTDRCSGRGRNGKTTMSHDPDGLDEPMKPCWRRSTENPRKAFADWRLVVRDGTVGYYRTYHVHKAVLAHGERASQFFVRQFEEFHRIGVGHPRDAANGGDKNKSVTEVALPRRSAQLVPALLDFIYEDKLPDKLDSKNAPAIRHLANHFDVRVLFSLMSSFIQRDLNAETVASYVDQANMVLDKELLGMATQTAAACLPNIPDAELLSIPPSVLPQIISHQQAIYPSSEWLSSLVARYVRGRRRKVAQRQRQIQQHNKKQQQQQQEHEQRNQRHGSSNSRRNPHPPRTTPPPPPLEEISDETFFFLTHAQILPSIAPVEAVWYLTFTKETYGPEALMDETMGKSGSLRSRCVVAIGRDWRETIVGPLRSERAHQQDGGNNSNNNNNRLFVEGEEEGDRKRLQIYRAMPMDLRVEILEESLLNAASGAPPPASQQKQPQQQQQTMHTRSRSNSISQQPGSPPPPPQSIHSSPPLATPPRLPLSPPSAASSMPSPSHMEFTPPRGGGGGGSVVGRGGGGGDSSHHKNHNNHYSKQHNNNHNNRIENRGDLERPRRGGGSSASAFGGDGIVDYEVRTGSSSSSIHGGGGGGGGGSVIGGGNNGAGVMEERSVVSALPTSSQSKQKPKQQQQEEEQTHQLYRIEMNEHGRRSFMA